MSFSASAFATIFAETETLSRCPRKLVTHTRSDSTPRPVGYSVEFKPGTTIKFRRYGGCMIGNLTPLIEACSEVNMIATTRAKQKNKEIKKIARGAVIAVAASDRSTRTTTPDTG